MRNILLMYILCWNCSAFAQLNDRYTFRHLDQTDGLLHTTVKGIGQDVKGFMWILTVNGLQRYDGSRFVNYPDVINQSSYGINQSSELFVDNVNHEVWVIKGNQMVRLNLADNKITSLTLEDLFREDTLNKAMIFTDENQNQWSVGENGVIRYDQHSQKINGSFININPLQNHSDAYVIKDSTTGDFWTQNFFSVALADRKTKKIYLSTDQHIEHPLLKELWKQDGGNSRIRYFMLDSHKNLWISTWTYKLFRYNFPTSKLSVYSLKEIKTREGGEEKGDLTLLVNAMYEDRQNNVWIATDYAGLLLFNREKDDFEFITSDDKISTGLRYNFSVKSIFQDRDDNIWLSTDRGISIFNPYRNNFQAIRHLDNDHGSMPKYEINDVIETPQGEILIATWGGGISVYDRQWNFIRNVKFAGPSEYNLVWCFVQNDDGTIWAGAQKGNIHIYDPLKHSFITIHPDETAQSTISTMVKDHDGNILIGLFNGKVVEWNKAGKKFYRYDDDLNPFSWPLQSVTGIYIDRKDNIWVASNSGLQVYDSVKHVYTAIFHPDSISSTKDFNIEGIEEYNDSLLLVGTIYKGVYFFNMHTKKFTRPFQDSLLDNTSVYAIKKDNENNIWFTSNYSLHKMNSDMTRQSRFKLNSYVLKAAFGSNHFYTLSDGRWVTTTPAEIICFSPEELEKRQRSNPDVEISGFKVFGKDIYIDSFLNKHKPVILPYNKNFISIEFSSLDFTDLQYTNYLYKLADVDNNWIQSGTKQFVDYTDLKSGKYEFRVRAESGNGSSKITSFPIVIKPPWWGTYWFRVLSVLALGSFIYFLIRKRILMIRKESELKHRIAETEMMALRSQMNPHFIFNCINSIDAMIQSNDKYRATVYLNKFAKLIRNVLDSSKQNRVPLFKDIETLQLYIDLELFRHQDKFVASLKVDDELMQNDYKVPPLIIQPYVENAILHGLRHKTDRGGKLSVTVTKQNEQIVYTIEDNGVGRKLINGDSHKHDQGYGMQMSNDRIRLFNGEPNASVHITDLDINGHPAGTRIQVHLKIQ